MYEIEGHNVISKPSKPYTIKFKKVYLHNERPKDNRISAWINGSREDFYYSEFHL